jgi:hypothetical protein
VDALPLLVLLVKDIMLRHVLVELPLDAQLVVPTPMIMALTHVRVVHPIPIVLVVLQHARVMQHLHRRELQELL